MWAATFREYGGPEVMRWEQLDDPACGRDDVLIRVRACGRQPQRPRLAGRQLPLAVRDAVGAGRGVRRDGGRGRPRRRAESPWATRSPPTSSTPAGRCAACARWRPDLCERFTVFGTDRWGGYAELVPVPARAVIAAARRAATS